MCTLHMYLHLPAGQRSCALGGPAHRGRHDRGDELAS
jgi:hypothetical protein